MANSYWENTQYFNPRQIANLSIWLDGVDPLANGVQPANGTSISTWVDKSNNANNVVQATGASQFVFTTGAVNGKASLLSSAIKSMATSGNPTNWPTGAAVPRSMFVVIYPIALPGATGIVSEDNGGNATAFDLDIFTGLSNGFLLDSGGSGQYVTFDSAAVSTGAPVMWSYVGNNSPFTSASVRVNSVFQPITNHGYTSGNVGATPFRLCIDGAGIGLVGYFCEVILYNALLSAAQEAQVLKYLTDKWGI